MTFAALLAVVPARCGTVQAHRKTRLAMFFSGSSAVHARGQFSPPDMATLTTSCFSTRNDA